MNAIYSLVLSCIHSAHCFEESETVQVIKHCIMAHIMVLLHHAYCTI